MNGSRELRRARGFQVLFVILATAEAVAGIIELAGGEWAAAFLSVIVGAGLSVSAALATGAVRRT